MTPTGSKTDFLAGLLNRFYASSLSKFYNHTNYRLHRFVQAIAETVRPEELLLDVGAGNCQYKRYFAGRCKYLSQDVGGKDPCLTYDQIDIRSDIYEIPLPDASVDVILCTQVLEHVRYPAKALKEMHRLLKPGGRLYFSVPFASDEHMLPHDFFRFTRFALDFLVQEQGFLKPEITPEGGRFILMGRLIKDLFPLLTSNVKAQRLIYLLQAPLIVPVLVLLYLLDPIDRNKHLTNNYEVIARKP